MQPIINADYAKYIIVEDIGENRIMEDAPLAAKKSIGEMWKLAKKQEQNLLTL